MPSAYTPGVPDAFLANFKQALARLDFLESRLNTKTALTSFRESDVLPLCTYWGFPKSRHTVCPYKTDTFRLQKQT